MKYRLAAMAGIFLAALLPSVSFGAASNGENPQAAVAGGPHDFDFQFGQWRVHHRVKRPDNAQWVEFDGTSHVEPLMDGSANVENNVFYKAAGISYGVALRTFDPKTRQWAIWWVDGRNPHAALDPAVKGQFANGIGRFYSDGVLNGKPLRTRFLWSQITATSAHWEQAYSFDQGKTWDTNWTMEFQRSSALVPGAGAAAPVSSR